MGAGTAEPLDVEQVDFMAIARLVHRRSTAGDSIQRTFVLFAINSPPRADFRDEPTMRIPRVGIDQDR